MTSEERLSRQAQAGRWLRDQRTRRGYTTAAEFARAVGVSKEVMSNYEVGRSTVPDDRAEQIAEALRLDVIEVRRNLGLWVPDGEAPPTEPDGDPLAGLPEDPDERLRALADRLQRVIRATQEVTEQQARIAAEMERLAIGRPDSEQSA